MKIDKDCLKQIDLDNNELESTSNLDDTWRIIPLSKWLVTGVITNL